jgi:hypothetical protein
MDEPAPRPLVSRYTLVVSAVKRSFKYHRPLRGSGLAPAALVNGLARVAGSGLAPESPASFKASVF